MIQTAANTSITTCVSVTAQGVVVAPVLRHRSFLKSGASTRALTVLLAVPAAISVGIVLSAPAHAQSAIGSGNSEVYLANGTNYPSGNPFTISAGTLISVPDTTAIYGSDDESWTLTNAGTVISTAGGGIYLNQIGTVGNSGTIAGFTTGLDIYGPGSVTNSGTITGSVIHGVALENGGYVVNQSGGYISGALSGIQVASAAGTVANAGSIHGNHYGVNFLQGGTVSNTAGTIYGLYSGVRILGAGSVTNSSTASVIGGTDGIDGGVTAVSVINAGMVNGGNLGINLAAGGSIANTGSIYGDLGGVAISGGPGYVNNTGTAGGGTISGVGYGVNISTPNGTVINNGLITQSGTGVDDAAVILAGGYLNNQSATSLAQAGVISGYTDGVVATGTDAINILNNGTIEGTGVNDGPWTNGIILGVAGGSITNGANGLISGATGNGILSNNGGVTVNNAGLITGHHYGIDSYNYLTVGANLGVSVTNSGTIAGQDGGIYAGTGYTTIHNTGLITGTNFVGVNVQGVGSIYNAGTITGHYDGIIAGGGAVGVSNFGQITGSFADAIALNNGGAVYNAGTAAIAGKYAGVYVEGGAGTVTNLGLITASKYDGVYFKGGGSINNSGTIQGAYAGVQSGYAGQTISHLTDLTNTGSIIGNSVAGVIMFGGGDVQNGAGGTIAVLTSAGSGIAIYAGAGSVNNSGVILGGGSGAGVNLAGGGAVVNYGYIGGGVGVNTGSIASDVLNFGSIIGGQTGVQLQAGGTVSNNVLGGCQTEIGAIYGSITGVAVSGAPGTVANYGMIGGGTLGTIGTGVKLSAGGSVANDSVFAFGSLTTGRIFGGATGVLIEGGAGGLYNAGTIYGHTMGVALLAGGSVDNAIFIGPGANSSIGTISGNEIGIYGGTAGAVGVTNAGLIGGTFAGIALLGGGSVNNEGGEIIGAGYGIRIAGPAQVTNNGLIAGFANIGVNLETGGTLANGSYGVIVGDNAGVFIGTDPHASIQTAGTVLNAGYIHASASSGIVMLSGGYVSNSAYGKITGAFGGVYLYAQPTLGNSIVNAGFIGGGDGGIIIGGDGVFSLANEAGGTITGGEGALIHASSLGTDLITNAGLVQGTSDSGLILRGPGAFNVVNQAGGSIIGDSYGLEAEANQLKVTNAGYIQGPNLAVYVGYGATQASITNLAGGTITSAHNGIQDYATRFSLDNAGLINATDGTALLVTGGTLASVTNQSTGTLYGYYYGLQMDAADNQVDNKGLISSPTEYYGVETQGTMTGIINESGATILGGVDGIISTSDDFTLDNAGSINAAYNDGVASLGTLGNVVINRAGGVITAPSYGVLTSAAGYVQNSGLIESEYAVAAEGSASSVLNTSTGTLSGSEEGIYLEDAGDISNAGQIIGTQYAGIELAAGGEVVNAGSITSQYYGILARGGDPGSVQNTATIFNGGLIEGLTTGLQLDVGGAVSNAAGALITGNTFGIVSGVSNASVTGIGTIFNSGDINGGATGIVLTNGGVVGNDAGAIITGGTYGIRSGYVGTSVVSTATIANSGLITGGNGGVFLTQGGVVTNDATGTITGAVYAVQSGYASSQTLATAGNIYNAGQLVGGAGGVLLSQGGVVTNVATGDITGGNIGIQADALTDINNAGAISGGSTGIDLAGGGTVVNTGNIAGGLDGLLFAYGAPAVLTNAGRITGTLGTGVALAGGALNNQSTGVIRGGVFGVLAETGAVIVNAGQILDAPAAGHAGVFLGGDASLDNTASGTIAGDVGVLVTGNDATITDSGVITSTDGGDAIQVMPTADPVQITLTTGAKLNGAIDGGGTAGTITLTGQNTLNNTVANFGAGSQLTIAPGAVWTGTGNWTIANVDNAGTFQAGTLGTPLNLTGNFNSTGTLNVIVTPTMSTQLIVTGAATLSGKLTYAFAPGTYTPGYKYNFLTASAGATGGFSDVTYIGATPAYVSKTTSVNFKNGVLGSSLTLGQGTAQGTAPIKIIPLDSSIFADANQTAALNAQAANDELLGKAAGAGGNDAACAAAARAMPNANDPRGTSLASQLTGAVANAFCGAGGWIEATGGAMTIDDSGSAAGYTANDAGFLAGIDKPVNEAGTKLGLAIGYDDAWTNDKAGGKTTAGTVRVGLYAAQPIGAFTLAGDLMYGHASDTSTRATGLGATTGNDDSDVINGGVRLSTLETLRGIDLTPAAGLKFAAVSTGGMAEAAPTGLSPFAVKTQTSSYASVQPYLNLRLSKSFTTQSLVTITPSVSLGYALEAGNTGKSVGLTSKDGTIFASSHTNLDASGAQFAAGIAAGKNNWSLYARYSATIAGNYTAQSGEAGLQINF